jgi:TPR repeat protein
MNAFKKAADLEYPPAIRELGMLQMRGAPGIPADMSSALVTLVKASQMGDPKAKTALAKILLQPYRVWTNQPRALSLLKEASKTDAEANLILAKQFERGRRFKKSKFMATELYGRAAMLGNDDAILKLVGINNREAKAYLGQLYLEGKVIPQDLNLAHQYLTQSLDQGYTPAKLLLIDLATREKDMNHANDLLHQFVISQQGTPLTSKQSRQ